MSSMRQRLMMIGWVVCLLAGGCTTSGEPTATWSSREPTSGPLDVRVVAVDYAYTEAPEEIPAGVIDLTFENRGSIRHEAGLSGIGETPIQQFVDDLGGHTGLDGFRMPDYLDQVAVPSFVSVAGGATGHATFTLSPGRYALWCAITDVGEGQEPKPHYQLGMMREITVVSDGPAVQLPEADGSIIARDYTFDVDVQAGDRTLTFLNDGPEQIHLSTVEVFPKGVSAQEAERAIEADLEPGRLPEGMPSPSGMGFSGIFSDGLGSTFRLYGGAFESGRTYVFRCFVPDREGGRGHYKAYGMYRIVSIE